jgi:hypothetical protein
MGVPARFVSLDYRSTFDSVAYEQGKLVSAAASAQKLARILLEGTFVSGAHIDFFDAIDAVS